MDSITHLTLGVCLGEVIAGKKLGNKAMVWGAVVHSLPDIDFITSFWMDTPGSLLAHRGFTHSFLFVILITPLLAWLARIIHRSEKLNWKFWIYFLGVVMAVHIFIDAFNNYGTGWWEPCTHQRISFHTIYVADPFFSMFPGLAFLGILYLKRQVHRRKRFAIWGLGLSSLYLMYCLINKIKIDSDVRSVLAEQQIDYTRYFTTPAPLQNWLWFVVAGNDHGYHVGFRSLFDRKKNIDFEYFPRNDSLLLPVRDHPEVEKLIRFSQDFYTVEMWSDTLVFNDLRFGQILGWNNPRGRFVFHYFLNHPDDNTLVVQRGRFKGWNKDVFFGLLHRIKGKDEEM